MNGRYRIQYWDYYDGEGSHGILRFEYFDDARQRYMHLLLDQIMERKKREIVRLERYSDRLGCYLVLFESKQLYPADAYTDAEILATIFD